MSSADDKLSFAFEHKARSFEIIKTESEVFTGESETEIKTFRTERTWESIWRR